MSALLDFCDFILVRLFNYISELVHIIKRIRPEVAPPNTIVLGTGVHPYHPNRQIPVAITSEQRARHLYVVGGTGAGKTKFLEGLIRQDIRLSNGFGIIDCHGDLIRDTLRFLSTLPNHDSIIDRVILLDPTRQDFSIGFNPLQITKGLRPYGQALELVSVFKKIWEYWGPRMDELTRNTLVTLAEHNLTLLEVQPLLTNDVFRAYLSNNLSHAEARSYWHERYDSLSSGMKSQYAEPLLNKTQTFVADPAIRCIIGQQKSTINFRDIMDQGKILLVNLSKGFLKENSLLLGALLLAKIQMATLSRSDIPEAERRSWYLYVDEFQNFATESFAEILSEARKYGLSLVMAHQSLSQLDSYLRASVFSNVVTQLYFAVSREDATILASELSLENKQNIIAQLIKQKTREAYVRIRGQSPMAVKTEYIPNVDYDEERVSQIQQQTLASHCRAISDIEAEIRQRREWIRPVSEGDISETSRAKKGTGKRSQAKFAPEEDFEEGK